MSPGIQKTRNCRNCSSGKTPWFADTLPDPSDDLKKGRHRAALFWADLLARELLSMGSFIVALFLTGFGLGFTLALNAKLILNFPDARTGLGDILRPSLRLAIRHGTFQRDFSVLHFDRNIARVDIGILGEFLVDVFCYALIRSFVALWATSRKRSLGRAILLRTEILPSTLAKRS